jgi:hypothetical protein
MSETGASVKQGPVTELKVTAHMMTLEPGLFCIFHAPTGQLPDRSGLPGVRLSLPPAADAKEAGIEIGGFRQDGWVSEFQDAALVRVTRTAQLLVSIYQAIDGSRAPNLQVMRIADAPSAVAAPVATAAAAPALSAEVAEVSAHIERRGDVLGLLGDWMGEPGSKRWIEGFALDPKGRMAPDDLEYQAVLGRGWLSPWVPAGEFCGSRGMALPILGLRVRLRGAAAERYQLSLSASFVDGSKVGPVGQDQAAEADSLAPLEAFQVQLIERAVRHKEPPALSQPTTRPARPEAVGDAKPMRRIASSLPAKPAAAKLGRRAAAPLNVAKGKPKRR